ncbi:ABC transporter ATP-binding protein [Desulfovibrio sulfodismutans]|uniref:ABC transporter ATP-binding protein n=1 Tax=Desulfolutivibrio sulfodismutans TaxID=63561 RepID=A0A7K3NPU0_9BACT|nr:ABC transporter ATP-binding protein [Desulfolutivibrio sulfodismutans]NDY58226.1 ABC transporter ATP-binding protein [Desulfolutivibrio sulfodismutans]QLA12812.1 ATP-binding cassette domain-containing protein [Desulfolutivibrio sulfodismutans DSM 3696]
MAFLEVTDVTLTFRGLAALTGVGFSVEKGGIVSLIGPNGAGKTSMLNCISGRYVPDSGAITLGGADLLAVPSHARTKLGLSRTFQNIALFRGLSVLDNLMVGRHARMDYGILASILYLGKARRAEDAHRRRVEDVIDFLGLSPYRHQAAGRLPYGVQKRVELGRALAAESDLILLDEPMAGMNLEETEDMARYILDINEEWGMSVLLVEHDMGVVMDISDKVVVLDFGRVLAEGSPKEVMADADVVAAYLGGDDGVFLGR